MGRGAGGLDIGNAQASDDGGAYIVCIETDSFYAYLSYIHIVESTINSQNMRIIIQICSLVSSVASLLGRHFKW